MAAGFGSVGFVTHAEFGQDLLGIGKNVHEMADRCALVAADIADAGFEQGLGQGENALAVEGFALADLEFLDFLGE